LFVLVVPSDAAGFGGSFDCPFFIAVYVLDGNRPRFRGKVAVPDRYPLPGVEQIVEVHYLYCHSGPDGKLIQAKYFGKVRDDIELAEMQCPQLKLKADDNGATES
jgi:hypothetical protein